MTEKQLIQLKDWFPGYQFKVQQIKGKDNIVPDYLSRNPRLQLISSSKVLPVNFMINIRRRSYICIGKNPLATKSNPFHEIHFTKPPNFTLCSSQIPSNQLEMLTSSLDKISFNTYMNILHVPKFHMKKFILIYTNSSSQSLLSTHTLPKLLIHLGTYGASQHYIIMLLSSTPKK